MTTDITGKRIAFIATDGVEEPELTEPWKAVQEAGGTPVLLSPEPGTITAMQGDWEHAGTYEVDTTVAEATAEDFDALILPGGTLNADSMRVDEDAVRLVKEFDAAGKPIAAICHAPWILIEAGLARGRRLTSYHSLSSDLVNAGAEWADEEVVVDGRLVTSRNPGDLEAFNRETLKTIAG
ncbi:type 1 glutamine amidotransferase domain-containing protein [Kocuria rosea]|jgi:protease I|uniref:type 1 glutamine amidotransferase domain-containing protein n=1 Tax=Kocuria rosea TaxID=1275 RepID=UPI00203B95DA|nr:type 1 glutamine amidotransferase domain-containing protein [Kocuria rosea]MCM3686508.1 type 1 glutamine amidotransferase [Kocuria rosea]HST70891.1 type 1 glutamine amidotransferase domain-containing protein [Kocuria rosea]